MATQKERLENRKGGMSRIKHPLMSDSMRARWKDKVYREARLAELRGRPVSEETRKKIRKAQEGRRRTEEYKRRMSLERGGVRVRAYPLLLRGGAVAEVALITGLSATQVGSLRDALRKRGQLPRPTKEQESEAKRRAHLGKPRNQHGKEYTNNQQNSFLFARRLQEEGFFTEDLSSWDALNVLYKEAGRKLPDNFADRLILEVFHKARLSAEKGDFNILDAYIRIENQVGSAWFDGGFTSERLFIRDALHTAANNEQLTIFSPQNPTYTGDDFGRARRFFTTNGAAWES